MSGVRKKHKHKGVTKIFICKSQLYARVKEGGLWNLTVKMESLFI